MFVPDVEAIKLWCPKVSESELHIEWFVWFERKQNHVKLILWLWGLEFWWILRGSVPYCSILYHDIWFAALPCQSVQRWIVSGSGSALKDDHGQFGTLGASPLSSKEFEPRSTPSWHLKHEPWGPWGPWGWLVAPFLSEKMFFTCKNIRKLWRRLGLSMPVMSLQESFSIVSTFGIRIHKLVILVFCDWKQSPSQVVPSLVRIVRCWGQGTLVHPACLVVNCHYNKCICIICSYVYVLASMLGFWQSGWYSKCHANSRGTRCRSPCQYFSDTFEFCNQHLNSMKVGRREADSFWTLF